MRIIESAAAQPPVHPVPGAHGGEVDLGGHLGPAHRQRRRSRRFGGGGAGGWPTASGPARVGAGADAARASPARPRRCARRRPADTGGVRRARRPGPPVVVRRRTGPGAEVRDQHHQADEDGGCPPPPSAAAVGRGAAGAAGHPGGNGTRRCASAARRRPSNQPACGLRPPPTPPTPPPGRSATATDRTVHCGQFHVCTGRGRHARSGRPACPVRNGTRVGQARPLGRGDLGRPTSASGSADLEAERLGDDHRLLGVDDRAGPLDRRRVERGQVAAAQVGAGRAGRRAAARRRGRRR